MIDGRDVDDELRLPAFYSFTLSCDDTPGLANAQWNRLHKMKSAVKYPIFYLDNALGCFMPQ